MVSEAALGLLAAADAGAPAPAGVHTPASALGPALAARLDAAGVRFEDDYDLAALPGEPDPAAA